MSGGALLAQVVHAAGESASANPSKVTLDTRACVLGATHDQLADLIDQLEDVGQSLTAVRETEGAMANVITAIGFLTDDRDSLKRECPILADLRPMK